MHGSVNESLSLLDRIYAEMRPGNVAEQMDRLTEQLQAIRSRSDTDSWRYFANVTCLRHPLRQLVHECPFSRRVFEKPRGYPGDAEMLDFAYGYSTIGSEATATTRELFEWTMQSSGLRSVRARRQILAEKIDEVAARSSQARVFAVGSGHLREAAVSRAIATGQLGDVIAFDRDRASLAVVARDYGANGVRIVQGRVQSLFDGTLELPTFDLVYSAGLYDYLPWWLARQLTTLLFGMVAPGGRLLIANAAPARPHAAYIEAYLDWWLIYRDEAQLTEVAEGIPDRDTQTRHSFQDREGNIVFLEVVKA